jgi:hypothetical protein
VPALSARHKMTDASRACTHGTRIWFIENGNLVEKKT